MTNEKDFWRWPSRMSTAWFDTKRASERMLGSELYMWAASSQKAARNAFSATFSFGTARRARRAEEAWSSGDVEGARMLWQLLAEDEPNNPKWVVSLSQAASANAEHERAEQILLDAQDRGVKSPEIDLAIDHYRRWRRRSNTAIDDALAVVSDPKASPFKVFYSAVYLSSEGLLEPARTGLHRLLDHRRLAHSARAQLAALDVLEKTDARDRPNIPGWLSPARSSAVVRAPGSDTVVIAFAPAGGLFGVPVNVVHAMLPRGVNAIYLYDSKHLNHMTGTDRFGPGYQSMISGLRGMVAEMGARKVITLGPSSAGFTAIYAGLDLEADGVVAFSPPTNATLANMEKDGRFPQIRLRTLRETPELMIDLRPRLENRTACSRIGIYYGDDQRQDRMHAEHLAGVRGVTLHPISGLGTHDSVGELVLRGQTDALERFVREG